MEFIVEVLAVAFGIWLSNWILDVVMVEVNKYIDLYFKKRKKINQEKKGKISQEKKLIEDDFMPY